MLLPLIRERAFLTLVVAISISGALITSGCGLFYIDRELTGPVTLNQTWLELTPSKPLTIARDTHEITLFPDPPIQMVDDPTGKRSLIPADGRDADIEIDWQQRYYLSV